MTENVEQVLRARPGFLQTNTSCTKDMTCHLPISIYLNIFGRLMCFYLFIFQFCLYIMVISMNQLVTVA